MSHERGGGCRNIQGRATDKDDRKGEGTGQRKKVWKREWGGERNMIEDQNRYGSRGQGEGGERVVVKPETARDRQLKGIKEEVDMWEENIKGWRMDQIRKGTWRLKEGTKHQKQR
uniref:Uncharacterized protein n=1 Tax=Nelumbo nucifera TaxID=4432 RepID=A0A822ZCU9_NELNU|nr:TPA_asm: hypothetical protein HUJ06_015824 [Nelumbo nucifera]